MNDEREMVNRLMQSLSLIDDDLLLDVEPAKVKNVIKMPLKRIDDTSAVERSHTALHAPSDVRRQSQRGRRKVLISVASVAACLVIAVGALYINNVHKASAPKGVDPKYDFAYVPENMNESQGYKSFEGVVAQDDYLLLLDSDEPVKVIESTDIPPIKPTTITDDEGASFAPRVITRFADQSARQVLSSGEANAVYSPLNLFQTIAFLAESADDDRRASFEHMYIDVFDEESDELLANSFPYDLATDNCRAHNTVLMGAPLYEQCDKSLLASLCNRFFFDVYTWERAADDPQPVVYSQSIESVRWNPENELLLTSCYDVDATLERGLAQVDLSEGLFHTPYKTLSNIQFYDSDDASLRHFRLDGAVACELPVKGGNLYLVLPDEGLTPDDLLAQDQFFTRLLTAEPAGTNAVARFPALDFIDRHNLVDSSGIEELRALLKAPASLRWLHGKGVTFPAVDQVVAFSLDGPVHEPDAHGLDAVDRMSLEAVFDRPFIFCLAEETHNTPILIGVYRHPER